MSFNDQGLPEGDSIKLPLYPVDPFQASDLIVYSQLHPNIRNWLGNIEPNIHYPIPQLTTSPSGVLILFQRYSAYKYPFANHYSTKLYYLLKNFTNTTRYTQYYFTGYKTDGSLNYGTASLGEPIPPLPFEDTLLLNLPDSPQGKTEFITISFYVNVPKETTQGIQPTKKLIDNPCYETNLGKEFALVNFKFPCKKQQVTLDTSRLLIASLVVDGYNASAVRAQIPDHYLYNYLDGFLEDLYDSIDEAFPLRHLLLKRMDYEIKNEIDIEMQQNREVQRKPPKDVDAHYYYTEQPVFDSLPSWYHFTSLIYANNPALPPEEIHQDLGNKVKLRISGNRQVLHTFFGRTPTGNYAHQASTPIQLEEEETTQYFYFLDEAKNGAIFTDLAQNTSMYATNDLWLDSSRANIDLTQGTGSALLHLHHYISYAALACLAGIDPILRTGISGMPVYQANPGIVSKAFIYRVEPDPEWAYEHGYDEGYAYYGQDDFQVKLYKVLGKFSVSFEQDFPKQFDFEQVEVEDIGEQTVRGFIGSYPPGVYEDGVVFNYGRALGSGTYLYSPPAVILIRARYSLANQFLYIEDYVEPPVITSLERNITGSIDLHVRASPPDFPDWHTEQFLVTKINQFFEDCPMAVCPDVEDIRKMVQEIHMSLEAGRFAYLEDSTEEARVANLGYYVERIARVLGISVNSDGSIRSIRNRAYVPDGETIPAGWSRGQWARNNGGSSVGQKGGASTHRRDGYAYEVRSNTLVGDPYSGKTTKIDKGGHVLVENIPQLLEVILDDLDKALGWGEAGANILPSPDGQRQLVYQGLNTLLTENAYMLSQLSRNITGTHISSLKNQAMLQEVLVGLGLPCSLREFPIQADADPSVQASVPYPGLVSGSPSLVDLLYLVLVNLGLLVGSNLKPQEEE